MFCCLTVFTEPSVVPCTVLHSQRVCIDVQVLTVPVVALPKLLKEVTNRHFGHVVLVQELALVPLLAQMSEPVLADDCTLSSHVTKWTVGASAACTNHKILAQSSLVFCR